MFGKYLVWAWEEKRRKYDRYIEDLKEATGASVEEEDYAGSLKHLQENMTLSKSKWGKTEASCMSLTLLLSK